MTATTKLSDNFSSVINEALQGEGVDLKNASDEFRQFSAQKIVELAACVGQPGYMEAVTAAADAVLEKSISEGITQADAIDARAIGLTFGALNMAARIAAAGAA